MARKQDTASAEPTTTEDVDTVESLRTKLLALGDLHNELVAQRDAQLASLDVTIDEQRKELLRIAAAYDARVVDLARGNARIEELESVLKAMQPGKVLEDRDGFETVIVRRKKMARPTGRIVPKANIRMTVPERRDREILRQEGARLNPEGDGHEHIVMLNPALPGQPVLAYTVPIDLFRQVVASGAAVEELG